MQIALTVIHLFLAIGLIGLILIQHGRGADAGAAFGSGASATVFGARGSGSFLSRTTAILAALFFVTSVVMAYYAQHAKAPEGLMDGAAGPIQVECRRCRARVCPVTIPAPATAGIRRSRPAAMYRRRPASGAARRCPMPAPVRSGPVPAGPGPSDVRVATCRLRPVPSAAEAGAKP